ncbi:MAG: YheC/YheD family protein [Bacillota bacterium]
MYRKGYNSRRIRGKLIVCDYLSASVELEQHIPQTVSFSLAQLEEMIGSYSTLYVKPDIGSHGIGIFKLKRLTEGFELYKIVKKKQMMNQYETLTDVFDRINAASSAKLIIQRGVELDRVNGRPYDIRAMVQRKKGGIWTVTGFLVKVGAADKIVTNYHQGGTIYTMNKLGKLQGLSASQTQLRIQTLTLTALKIGRLLSEKQSGMHEMGIDFAYDVEQQLWVLEVNSNRPQFGPLKRLDRRAYDRMKRFAASYGRRSH